MTRGVAGCHLCAVVLGLLCTAGTVLTVDGAANLSPDTRVAILIIIGIVAWLIASLILARRRPPVKQTIIHKHLPTQIQE